MFTEKISASSVKKLASVGMLVVGGGVYSHLQASECNDYYDGRCDQWCIDNGHGPYALACGVNESDQVVCFCYDAYSHTL